MDSKKTVVADKTKAANADVQKAASKLASEVKKVEEKTSSAVKKATDSVKTSSEKAVATAKTKAAETKKAVEKKATATKTAVKKTAEKKTAVKKAATPAKTTIVLQNDFGQALSYDDIVAKVKAQKKNAKDIAIYLKPSDNKAYYVVDGEAGDITLF